MSLRRALAADALDVVPARRRAVARDLGRADAGRARAAAQPLVHAPHLDQRDRVARQPARLLRRRRRPVPRVPLRPAGLDSGTARLHARRAAEVDADGCLARTATRPGLGIALDEEAVAHYAVLDADLVCDRSVHRRPVRARRRRADVRQRVAARWQRARGGRPRRRRRHRPGRAAARGRRSNGGDWAYADPAAARPRARPPERADARAARGGSRSSSPATPAIRSATRAASTSPGRPAASPGTARRSTRSTARSRRPPPTRSR